MAEKQQFSQNEVIKLLKAAMKESGGLVGYANKIGVSKQYLRGVLARHQMPGPKVGFKKIKTSIRFVKTRSRR